MSDWLLLTLAALACYRLAMLITKDEITRPIRNYFGLHSSAWVREHLGYLINCPYCCGIWVAAALTLLLWPISWDSLLYLFAIAGAQSTLQKISDGAGGLEKLGERVW